MFEHNGSSDAEAVDGAPLALQRVDDVLSL